MFLCIILFNFDSTVGAVARQSAGAQCVLGLILTRSKCLCDLQIAVLDMVMCII